VPGVSQDVWVPHRVVHFSWYGVGHVWLDRLRHRRDRGASIIEWGALLLIVGLIVVALVAGGVPGDVGTYTRAAICKATGGVDCELPTGGVASGGR